MSKSEKEKKIDKPGILKLLFWLSGLFVVAIYPIVSLYALNIEELKFNQILLPVAISFGLTGILFFIWLGIYKKVLKASLATIPFVFIVWYYGLVYNELFITTKPDHFLSISLFLVLYGFIVFSISKIKPARTLENINLIITIPVFLLLIFNIITIIPAELKKHQITKNIQRPSYDHPELDIDGRLPDIYVLVFDEFASFTTIEDVWGFENKILREYLLETGVFIAENSRTRFRTTSASLASLLNLEYVTVGLTLNEILQLYDKNFVMSFLHNLGYKITFIDGYGGFSYSQHLEGVHLMDLYNMQVDDEIITDPFHFLLINQSVLLPWADQFKDNTPNLYYRTNKYFLNFIENFPEEVNKMDQPSFLYAHLMTPHLPYVYDSSGNFLENPTNYWEYTNLDNETKMDLYLEQYIYISSRIIDLIENILQKSVNQPIIMILSDHGVREESTGSTDPEHIYRVLNAVYFPDNDYSELYDSIAPLNAMRVILNKYFAQSYPMLEDR
jgi:hypothetical protein